MLYDSLTEEELASLLKEGNTEAFTRLYEKYSAKIYTGILKLVKNEEIAEEIVQEIFTRIWQKRESIKYESSFSSYIYRIGQNLVKDYYRKLQRDHTLYLHFKEIATQHYTHVEEAILHNENRHILNKALMSLSPQQRSVYQLCKVEGLSYKEAAETLGISHHTVKEYLSKANQSLKTYLMNHPDTTSALLVFMFFTAAQ